MSTITEVIEKEILFARKNSSVIIPTKRGEDACYDIYPFFSEDYIVIQPHETKMITTGLYSAFNKKWKLELLERGSTGAKGIGQRAGQIDSGFRGEIKVPITNHNNVPLVIAKSLCTTEVIRYELLGNPGGEGNYIQYPYEKAICQASLVEVPVVTVREISLEELQAIPSERGEGMTGSSGK